MNKKDWTKPTIIILNEKILSGSSNSSFAEYVFTADCVGGVCVLNAYTTYSSVSGATPSVYGSNPPCTVEGAACS